MIKLKNILSEAYAWERQDGRPLPTLKDVQEAYDAKGVEDAVDEAEGGAKPDYIDLDKDGNEEESMKQAALDAEADSKEVNEEETEDESDEAVDAADVDMDVLNMESLEESTFWGRVKGNLHGHEYILREAFRK
jgi:hypothetical protein